MFKSLQINAIGTHFDVLNYNVKTLLEEIQILIHIDTLLQTNIAWGSGMLINRY